MEPLAGSCGAISTAATEEMPKHVGERSAMKQQSAPESSKRKEISRNLQTSLLMASLQVLPSEYNPPTKSVAHLPPDTTSDLNVEVFSALSQMDGDADDFEDSEACGLDFGLANQLRTPLPTPTSLNQASDSPLIEAEIQQPGLSMNCNAHLSRRRCDVPNPLFSDSLLISNRPKIYDRCVYKSSSTRSIPINLSRQIQSSPLIRSGGGSCVDIPSFTQTRNRHYIYIIMLSSWLTYCLYLSMKLSDPANCDGCINTPPVQEEERKTKKCFHYPSCIIPDASQ